jgi:hypothetical protein
MQDLAPQGEGMSAERTGECDPMDDEAFEREVWEGIEAERRAVEKPPVRIKGKGRGKGSAQRAKPVWSARNRPPHHHP